MPGRALCHAATRIAATRVAATGIAGIWAIDQIRSLRTGRERHHARTAIPTEQALGHVHDTEPSFDRRERAMDGQSRSRRPEPGPSSASSRWEPRPPQRQRGRPTRAQATGTAAVRSLSRAPRSEGRDALVEQFLPLATRLAQRYHRGAEPLDDLVQVASVGLLKAIDRFDPDRGAAFSPFAVPTIAGELKRHYRDKGWALKVPRDLQELAQRVDRTTDRLIHELGRTPTVDEVAGALGIAPEQVLEAREAGDRVPSPLTGSPLLRPPGRRPAR
jgi:RNA polymerase sigma factor (sigma-70 family)